MRRSFGRNCFEMYTVPWGSKVSSTFIGHCPIKGMKERVE